MTTLMSVALAAAPGIPVATNTPGPLTNIPITPVTAPVTGSSADDVTAAAENAECATSEDYIDLAIVILCLT